MICSPDHHPLYECTPLSLNKPNIAIMIPVHFVALLNSQWLSASIPIYGLPKDRVGATEDIVWEFVFF